MSATLQRTETSSAMQQLVRKRSRLPQRRFAVGGLVIVAAITYLIIASFSSAVASVVSPGQLLHGGAALYGQSVRLQGKVVGADHVNPSTLAHVFSVTDGHATVTVSYASDLPGGFKPGASIEAQGIYNGHEFSASTLTAKCPTKYQAARGT